MVNDQKSMAEIAPSIDLDLANKLRNPEYRQKFFLAESSALIAEQLVELRKRRDLSQKQVAEMAGTRQPAISRAEQANYQNWSFNTLRSIADVLNARIRVLIQATEDIIHEYETPPSDIGVNREQETCSEPHGGSTAWNDFFPAGKVLGTPVNDDAAIPSNPEIGAQVLKGRMDLIEERERRIG